MKLLEGNWEVITGFCVGLIAWGKSLRTQFDHERRLDKLESQKAEQSKIAELVEEIRGDRRDMAARFGKVEEKLDKTITNWHQLGERVARLEGRTKG